MKWFAARALSLSIALASIFSASAQNLSRPIQGRRLVILKVDGLNADLLYAAMRETNSATGKSRLPWFSHIFAENGTIFENFYTRGISLSAPSWSMLDTGRHTIIRGNVEYDRYTGHIYDYLNFFPFYLGYARNRIVDMLGVEVLDRAGIPLLIDSFPYAQRFQSFQLYQRGVRWTTLEHVLERRLSTKVLFSMVESAGTSSLDQLLARQTETELKQALKGPEIFYADFYTGDVDHEGHATNQPAALFDVLKSLDGLAGRIWSEIQAEPLANETVFVVVSDHGMNNVPGVFSQAFSLPDLFNSPAGGAHHVITNRHQLSDYKIMGLNPLVQRVITPSTTSFYLAGEAERYPTAWLDLDGNERASVHLRNSDLNKIHILLLQLARPDLTANVRRAAVGCLKQTIERHRAAWMKTSAELDEEMAALEKSIADRRNLMAEQSHHATAEEHETGKDKTARRLAEELQDWEREHAEYTAYIRHIRALLSLQFDPARPFRGNIADVVPPLTLGDGNNIYDLENYVAGPSARGLVLDAAGNIDEAQSFRHINYFSTLTSQHARNNPQAALSPRPIDFLAMRVPDTDQQSYWIYGDEENQLIVRVESSGQIAVVPVKHFIQDRNGKTSWDSQEWRTGLPFRLFEDANLQLPS
ncbi:MAG: alkaline phosphatase family protein, partial [Acidobacteriaceae bacterium]|nr:alkaline phosphatase family protein [Acidobacteriaceae bacterium]